MIPLFIVMGGLMNEAGLTQNLIDFANLLVGKLKGGLACINSVASMIFGEISGSSTADVASVGAILIPEMERRGYEPKYAAGLQTMRTLARNMTFLMRSIQLGKEKYGLPEREAPQRTNFIR